MILLLWLLLVSIWDIMALITNHNYAKQRVGYIADQIIMTLSTTLQWQQNVKQTMNSQKTPHNSPSRASYGLSAVGI